MVIVRLLDGTEYNSKIKLKKIVREPPRKKTFQERYPEYDPTVNYKDEHLDWLSEKPKGYCPVWAVTLISNWGSYSDYMAQMYYGWDSTVKKNETAFLYYHSDCHGDKKRQNKTATTKANELFGLTAKKDTRYPDKWFVTFGWPNDGRSFTKKQVETGVQRLFMKEWVLEARGCFEYYGKDRNHPHFMCVLKINQDVFTISEVGKFRKVIKESSLASKIKAKNCIQFQPFEERHDEYVDLIKCDAKQEALDKDRAWRNEKGLRHHYNKTDYMKDY